MLNFIAKQLQQVSSVITVDEMLFAMHAPDGFLEPGTALVIRTERSFSRGNENRMAERTTR